MNFANNLFFALQFPASLALHIRLKGNCDSRICIKNVDEDQIVAVGNLQQVRVVFLMFFVEKATYSFYL